MAQETADHLTRSADQGSQAISLADFRESGLAIADWASKRGFSKPLVYAILRGERKCLRGQSFQIARTLGMKK